MELAPFAGASSMAALFANIIEAFFNLSYPLENSFSFCYTMYNLLNLFYWLYLLNYFEL